jgi:hypothetical protein
VANTPRQPNAADRFSELMRAMAKEEGDAALAVFFGQSVTTINNWCKGAKSPRDIDKLVQKCGLSGDELLTADEQSWRAAVQKVLSTKRVLITPGWLHLDERLSFLEKSTQSPAIIILTASAYNDTQWLEVQSLVRNNISRGVSYIYVIPEDGCEFERPLERFVKTLNLGGARRSTYGTAKILRTHTTKKTTRQWKRIDHVMLFARGEEGFPKIESLSDILQVQIEEGYEQLYKAGDQPYGDSVWKSLSIREIDYYKELLEEWSGPSDDDEERWQLLAGLQFIGSSDAGHEWESNNIRGLRHVNNTLYRSAEGTNARVMMTHLDDIVRVMVACISQGCYWRDLGLFGQDEFISRAYKSLPAQHRHAYSAAVLPVDIPIIQMRCMQFTDDRSAVLLGWGFPGSDVPRVFLSEDTATVRYFRSYFDTLYSRSIRLYEYGREVSGG